MASKRLHVLVLAFFLTAILFVEPVSGQSEMATESILRVPGGSGVVIKGELGPGEWSDAKSINIEVEPGWKVTILFKHDSRNLYFAFEGLVRDQDKRFPELLIDPQGTRSKTWRRGEWWLHSSFNLCEGNGDFNVYERRGVFQCSQEKTGWSANHFPLTAAGAMEIQISLAKLDLTPKKGTNFGLAIDLTDTQEHWTFWPTNAQLAHPNTWGKAVLE
jgi:hypothetical protein